MRNSSDHTDFTTEVDAYVDLVIHSIPATAIKLQAIREAQASDEVFVRNFLIIANMDDHICTICQDHFAHTIQLLHN